MALSAKQPTLIQNISNSNALSFGEKTKSLSLAERIDAICNNLEESRILLFSAFILIQGCILVPAVILLTSFIDIGLGNITLLFLTLNTFAILVSNISLAPIKAILFTFAFSVLSIITLIAIHLLSLL